MINAPELLGYVLKAHASHLAQRKLKKQVAGLSFGMVVAMLTIGCIVALVTFLFKDTRVGDGDSDTTLLLDIEGHLIATAEATVSMPLLVLPVLSTPSLGQIKTIELTYQEPAYNNASVTTLLGIASATRVNSTAVELVGTQFDTALRVWNGEAHLLKGGLSYPVCYSTASCSSVKVSESEMDGLVEAADDALESIGIERGTVRRSLTDGGDCGTTAATGTCICPKDVNEPCFWASLCLKGVVNFFF